MAVNRSAFDDTKILQSKNSAVTDWSITCHSGNNEELYSVRFAVRFAKCIDDDLSLNTNYHELTINYSLIGPSREASDP